MVEALVAMHQERFVKSGAELILVKENLLVLNS
jgi:hypothetical protein